MSRFLLSEIPCRVLGRSNGEVAPLTLFWTASGVELAVRGSELWVEMAADWASFEPWYSFELNGAFLSRRMAARGTECVCVFRGMNPETVKRVRILKDTQAQSGDPQSLLQICAVETDGAFVEPPVPALRLEFIGDSITSGEGDVGAKTEEDWISAFFSVAENYAVKTARALNADVRILSQSGWGVCCAWDNNPNGALPPVYEQICGLLSGARNEALGAQLPHDFAAWQPDAVIVNLGTNDCGAFSQPMWTDGAGKSFQNRRTESGAPHPDDLARFEGAVVEFLKTLRRCNPCARLVWVYGMLGLELAPAIERAVQAFCRETGDENAVFLPLTDDLANRGCRNHPGAAAHDTAAAELVSYLRGSLPGKAQSLY